MFKNPSGVCPCPNKDCVRNENCDECKAFHKSIGGLSRCERDAANTVNENKE